MPGTNYRNLGTSGLQVSPICLGTMMFGERTDEAEAGRIVAAAREAGVNFIDTADVYSKGESERITGRLIKSDRARWVLATKVANAMPGPGGAEDANRRGTSRKWIMQAIDESLARLGADYVDVYYLHRDVEATPLEETVRAMDDLIRAGKIRHFALSNFRGWRIAQVMHVCSALGAAAPVCVQPYYNAMNRQPENEILPACAFFGLGVVPRRIARDRADDQGARGEEGIDAGPFRGALGDEQRDHHERHRRPAHARAVAGLPRRAGRELRRRRRGARRFAGEAGPSVHARIQRSRLSADRPDPRHERLSAGLSPSACTSSATRKRDTML